MLLIDWSFYVHAHQDLFTSCHNVAVSLYQYHSMPWSVTLANMSSWSTALLSGCAGGVLVSVVCIYNTSYSLFHLNDAAVCASLLAYIIILLSFNLMPFLFCFSQNQERPWAPTSDFDGTICHPFFAADISLMSSHVARTLLRFRKQCAPDSSAMQLERTLRKATKHLWTTRLCTSTPPVPFLIGNQTGKLQQTHMSSRWSPLSRDPNRTNLCGSVHT